MPLFICPKCQRDLKHNGKCLVCENGHCFDIAKENYVNLLMSNASSKKHHGDDRLMVNARRQFLSKDFYFPLCESIAEKILKTKKDRLFILDAGCGEGYYTDKLYNILKTNNKTLEICGIDISKSAILKAAKQNKYIEYAVAGVNKIPVKTACADFIISIFAPVAEDEFNRILTNDGAFIRVFPLENHLMGLKNAIYDNPIKNDAAEPEFKNFMLTNYSEIKYNFTVKNEDAKNLFVMTPYFYKTSEKDQKNFFEKIDNGFAVETEIGFGIQIFKKTNGITL